MDRDNLDCKIPIIMLCIGTIISHGVLIWFAWKSKKLNDRFRILVINVGLINILFIISNLMRISMYDALQNDNYFIACTRSFFKYTRWVRFLILSWIAIERVLACWKPIKFRTVYSHYSTRKILACLWLFPLIYAFIMGKIRFGRFPTDRVNIPVYLHGLMLVFLTSLYASIPCGMRKSIKITVTSPQAACESARRARVTRINREWRTAIIAFGIVSTHVICNLPIIITAYVSNTNLPLIAVSCSKRQSRLVEAANFLFIIDVALDPIWYFFGNYLSDSCFNKVGRRKSLQGFDNSAKKEFRSSSCRNIHLKSMNPGANTRPLKDLQNQI